VGNGLHIALEGLQRSRRSVISQLELSDGLIDEGIVLRWTHLLSVEDELAKFEAYSGVVDSRWDQSCAHNVSKTILDAMELSMHD
jgi:hypothetical protein